MKDIAELEEALALGVEMVMLDNFPLDQVAGRRSPSTAAGPGSRSRAMSPWRTSAAKAATGRRFHLGRGPDPFVPLPGPEPEDREVINERLPGNRRAGHRRRHRRLDGRPAPGRAGDRRAPGLQGQGLHAQQYLLRPGRHRRPARGGEGRAVRRRHHQGRGRIQLPPGGRPGGRGFASPGMGDPDRQAAGALSRKRATSTTWPRKGGIPRAGCSTSAT